MRKTAQGLAKVREIAHWLLSLAKQTHCRKINVIYCLLQTRAVRTKRENYLLPTHPFLSRPPEYYREMKNRGYSQPIAPHLCCFSTVTLCCYFSLKFKHWFLKKSIKFSSLAPSFLRIWLFSLKQSSEQWNHLNKLIPFILYFSLVYNCYSMVQIQLEIWNFEFSVVFTVLLKEICWVRTLQSFDDKWQLTVLVWVHSAVSS